MDGSSRVSNITSSSSVKSSDSRDSSRGQASDVHRGRGRDTGISSSMVDTVSKAGVSETSVSKTSISETVSSSVVRISLPLGNMDGVHHAAGYASVSPSASVNIAGLAPAAVPAVGGLYAGAGRYVANSAGTVHVAKREAEADADAYYAAGYGLGYAGLGYAGLGYAGLGYAGLGHHVAAGYSNVSPSGSLNIAGLAPAAIPAVGGAYAGAGRYVANSAGTVHVA